MRNAAGMARKQLAMHWVFPPEGCRAGTSNHQNKALLCATIPESSSLNSRIAYSIAVTAAAGTLATEADAAVVYSGPQNINIGSGSFQQLDLDSSGSNDIKLTNYVFTGGPYQGVFVNFAPGKLVGFSAGLLYASALSAGDTIDSSSAGPSYLGSLAYGPNNPNAQFNNANGAFIGFSFPQSGNLLYGWLRVDINNASGTFLVRDWGYESTPGMGIAAGAVPEPSALGWLTAGGVAGIAAPAGEAQTPRGAGLISLGSRRSAERKSSALQRRARLEM